MLLITRRSIGEAHEEVIRVIIERSNGNVRVTEDEEITYDPEEPVCIHIEEPFSEPMRSSASLFGERFSEQYQASLYTITPRREDGTDAVYTYGNRLRDYPHPVQEMGMESQPGILRKITDPVFRKLGYLPASGIMTLSWKGDGRTGGIDQIQRSLINRLIENPNSRRAIAITWVPEFDISRDEPPCLQIIQCIITRENKLNLVCLFRSNDMLSAWGQNAYGLAHLQRYIIDGINSGRKRGSPEISQGWLETISVSAHMYFKRDQLELMQFTDKNKVIDAFSRFQKIR
jgi:thymidylate synthase